MAAVTPKRPTLTGIDPLPDVVPEAGGDTFAANASKKYKLHFKNTDVAARTVTLDDPTSSTPLNAKAFNADVDISVPATGEWVSLIDSPARFINSDGNISMTYPAGVTGLTLQVYEV